MIIYVLFYCYQQEGDLAEDISRPELHSNC